MLLQQSRNSVSEDSVPLKNRSLQSMLGASEFSSSVFDSALSEWKVVRFTQTYDSNIFEIVFDNNLRVIYDLDDVKFLVIYHMHFSKSTESWYGESYNPYTTSDSALNSLKIARINKILMRKLHEFATGTCGLER